MGRAERDRLVDRILEAVDDPKSWAMVASSLQEILACPVALFLPFPSAQDPGQIYAVSIDMVSLQSYQERYYALDPACRRIEDTTTDHFAFHGSPGQIGRQRAFDREWLEPQGFAPEERFVALLARDIERRSAVLMAFRQRRGNRLPWDALLGSRLMDHLGCAARATLRAERLQRERDRIGVALDRVPVGVILVEASGRVIAANQMGQRILSSGDGLKIERSGLRIGASEASEALMRALKVSAGGSCGGHAFRVPRPSGRRDLAVRIEPAGMLNVAAVFVSDPEETLHPTAVLRALYGLTPAEAALASELANGLSLADAGARLGVRHATARTRLKQVFLKTDTHRQTDLLRLLLMGPARLLD